MAEGVSNVFPQSSKRIEQFAPGLDKIISTSEPIQELANGFGGDDWKTLYFTSRNHLGSVNVNIPGIPVPNPKK